MCTPPSTLVVAPLETTCQCCGAVTETWNTALRSGWSMQALARVGIAAVGVDHDDVVFGQTGQLDTDRLVVTGHIQLATVEGGAVNLVGGDVDDGVGAGERSELHGGDRPEDPFARPTVAVGEVEVDPIAVDGDQRGAFGGLVTGEIR